MNPKISILMANYNNAKYIKQAIESVLNQNYKNWELIIVDDKSTDNSLEIIKHYLKDKRIRLIEHKKNKGCGATKKKCADNAKGEIIGVLDPDDVLDKKALEIMVKAHDSNPDYGLIYSTSYNCDSNLKNKKIAKWVGEIKKRESDLIRPRIFHFVTIKKKIYDKTKGFDSKQKRAMDKDLFFKLEEITKVKFINKPLYYYRNHEKGISQGKNIRKAHIFFILAMCKAYKRRLNTNIPNITKKEFYKLILKLIYLYTTDQLAKIKNYLFC